MADPEHVSSALYQAFQPGSRAVLFLWRNCDGLPGAFAFGVVASGLESGSDYLWINELHIEHSFRRRGLASAMLEYIEAWVQRNGIHYLVCVTGVQNQAAQGLYKSRGFDLFPVQWALKRI